MRVFVVRADSGYFGEGYFGKPQRRFFYVLVALMLLAEWYFFDLRNLKTGLAALFGW